MNNKKKLLQLLIVPLIFIGVSFAFGKQMFPIYANTPFYGQDPAYQYLFAGVDILLGNAPSHNDHPGTPLQSLIALTIAAVWSLRSLLGLTNQEIFVSVLASPELYLLSVSIVVVAINATAIYIFGKQIYKVTKDISAAAICQLMPLTFVLVAPNILYPAPESMLWSATLLLLAVLAPALIGSAANLNNSTPKIAILAGVIGGIGLAIKVTFLPMIGLLLVLRKLPLILLAMIMLVVSWFIGVLPIYSRLGGMFSWLGKVINHSGLHGEGQKTLFDISLFLSNLTYVRNMYPLLDMALWGLILICFIGLAQRLFFKFRNLKTKKDILNVGSDFYFESWRAIVLAMVIIGQIFMVAKHPGPTYMIPVLPITAIVVVWFVHAQKFIRFSNTLKKGLSFVLLVFFIYQATNSSIGAYKIIEANQVRGEQSNRIIKSAISRFQNPVLIGTFNCTFPLCALWFGQLMTPEVELKMDQVTNNFYHFDIFAKNLHVPGRGGLSSIDTAQEINHFVETARPVLLISPPYDQLANFEVEKIVDTPVQILYRVLGYKASP